MTESAAPPSADRSSTDPAQDLFGHAPLARTIAEASLDMDSDEWVAHYRLQKTSEQQADFTSDGVVVLKPATAAGIETAHSDEQKKLPAIVGKMYDLFFGPLSEGDMAGYFTTIEANPPENATPKELAATNSGHRLAVADFADILNDFVIDGQKAHDNIAALSLKDERTFAAMRGMLAALVWHHSLATGSSDGW